MRFRTRISHISLRAHVKAGFNVAVDMLTRSSMENDFAPDASVYEAARDEETGGRQLEQLAFEIVNEQALATQTTKARELTARGVRRVFVLIVKHRKMLEWSRETDAWSATPLETIDDACFVRPLDVSALVNAVDADESVLRALVAKGHPVLDAVREAGREEGREAGREEGREAGREEGREAGREEGLRTAIADLCETLAIDLSPARAQFIAEARNAGARGTAATPQTRSRLAIAGTAAPAIRLMGLPLEAA